MIFWTRKPWPKPSTDRMIVEKSIIFLEKFPWKFNAYKYDGRWKVYHQWYRYFHLKSVWNLNGQSVRESLMSLPWNCSKEQIICGISTLSKIDQTVDEKNRPKIKLVIDRVAKVMKPGPMSSLKFIISTWFRSELGGHNYSKPVQVISSPKFRCFRGTVFRFLKSPGHEVVFDFLSQLSLSGKP